MGWLQKLIETYDVCASADQFAANSLPPISHTPQQAHIEIVIDEHGNFRRAHILQKEEALIPATEESAGRVGTKPPPHPFCDKIQYVAADYPTHGGTKPSFHTEYLEQLTAWCVSPFAHPKAQAVLDYVRRGRVVNDLVKEQLLYLDSDGTLLTQWPAGAPKPDIFRLLPAGNTDQGNAFIRWQVEILGDPASTIAYRHVVVDGESQIVAGDPDLQSAWVQFNASQMQQKGLCMASGEAGVALAGSHPKRLRHPGDGAKLISSNDKSGFTFRGRFTDDSGDQACTIGYGASQKAHLALRWLIGRQAYRNGDQVVVSWSVGGEEIPDPLADPFTLFGVREAPAETAYEGDIGQTYALALKLKIAGYLSRLPPSASIIVMALDSATPGRLSIVFIGSSAAPNSSTASKPGTSGSRGIRSSARIGNSSVRQRRAILPRPPMVRVWTSDCARPVSSDCCLVWSMVNPCRGISSKRPSDARPVVLGWKSGTGKGHSASPALCSAGTTIN